MSKYASHPTWVRGLKFMTLIIVFSSLNVAPYMGAWIEIPVVHRNSLGKYPVAPYMGAWIEMCL